MPSTRLFMVGARLPAGKRLLPQRYQDGGTAWSVAGTLGRSFGVGLTQAKGVESMLRISGTITSDSLMRLTVEGTLAAEWVPLLEAECLRHLDARKPVELDFAGVSFVDRGGAAMVRRLVARGAQVTGASGLVKALLGRQSGEESILTQSNTQGETS